MTNDSIVGTDESADVAARGGEDRNQLLPQLVAHLREHRSRLRAQWAEEVAGMVRRMKALRALPAAPSRRPPLDSSHAPPD